MFKVFLLITTLYASANINFVYSKPQLAGNNLTSIINDLFTTPRTPDVKGGFEAVVTPEPFIPTTSSPQTFVTESGKCICVPYYLCDTETNTINLDGEIDGFGKIDIRFDDTTCRDPLDVCCNEGKTVTEPIKVPTNIGNPSRPQGCGLRNVGGLDFEIAVNTDNLAGFGEFPWTVALLKLPNDQCVCGGSLIHPQIVLTGNHCVRKLQPQVLKIRAGEWDTQTTKERLQYQERVARQIVGHPNYDPETLAFDFALVVLTQPFELADHINTVCLPPSNFVYTSNECYSSGWGKDVFGKAGKYSVIMKRTRLPIVPNNVCENELRKTRLGAGYKLSNTFICAGGEAGRDTCEGDGGAPLVCPIGASTENRYSQYGIVAWGIGCYESRPGVYGNVAFARDWIDRTVTSLGFTTESYTIPN